MKLLHHNTYNKQKYIFKVNLSIYSSDLICYKRKYCLSIKLINYEKV